MTMPPIEIENERRRIYALLDSLPFHEWESMPGNFLGIDPEGKSYPIPIGSENIKAVVFEIAERVREKFGNLEGYEADEIKSLKCEVAELRERLIEVENKVNEIKWLVQ